MSIPLQMSIIFKVLHFLPKWCLSVRDPFYQHSYSSVQNIILHKPWQHSSFSQIPSHVCSYILIIRKRTHFFFFNDDEKLLVICYLTVDTLHGFWNWDEMENKCWMKIRKNDKIWNWLDRWFKMFPLLIFIMHVSLASTSSHCLIFDVLRSDNPRNKFRFDAFTF